MIALRDLGQHLDEWRGAGLIDERQLRAIEHYEESHGTPEPAAVQHRIPVIAEAVGYLGAALAGAAVMTFAINEWRAWTDLTRLVILAAATLGAFLAGWFTRTSIEPAIRRFSAVMWAVTAGATFATMALLGNDVLDLAEATAVRLAAVSLLVVGTGLYLLRRHGLLQLAMLAGVIATTVAIYTEMDDAAQLPIGLTLLGVGAAWFALGWRDVIVPGRVARIAGVVVANFGTSVLYDGTPGRRWALLLAAVIAIAVVALSIVLRQPELTFIGAVFTFQNTLIWVNETFSGTLGVPVALLLAGTLAIGAALVLTRRMRGGPRLHG